MSDKDKQDEGKVWDNAQIHLLEQSQIGNFLHMTPPFTVTNEKSQWWRILALRGYMWAQKQDV